MAVVLFEWLVLEQICPDEVGHEEASRYRNLLAEKYLPSTIARKIVSARLFFDMAQARGGVTRNPFLEARMRRQTLWSAMSAFRG